MSIIRKVVEVDSETGEVVNEYGYNVGDDVELVQWRLDNFMLSKYKVKSRFTKNFQTEDSIPKYKSRTFLGHFFIIQKKLAPEFNYIGKLTKDKGWVGLTRQEIQELLEISSSSLKSFIKESQELKVIRKISIDERGEYFVVNPIYGFNGNCINFWTYFVFKDDPNFIKSLSKEDLKLISMLEHKQNGVEDGVLANNLTI